ncbi:ABC transporter ATP-binding protein [Candidatus Parcubacteria bacterium]|nr:ABC transporter ATP-binding protein [Candidatus Parcubacteria bacterium]
MNYPALKGEVSLPACRQAGLQASSFSGFHFRRKRRDIAAAEINYIMLLEIKNLKVGVKGKEILKYINLNIKKGEIQALLGPNASGKSTLAQVILGNPKYKITEGSIFFNKKNITKLSPDKRVKLGIALSWQNPPVIKGVKLSQLLKEISMFRGSASKHFNYEKQLLEREVNVDFSGGEKKMSELLQVLTLEPKLVIFDEIDSGLDLKRLGEVSEIIKKELLAKKVSILLITHSGEILKFLKPNITNVMVAGKIICKEKDYKKVLKTIKKYGYEKCKKCRRPSI